MNQNSEDGELLPKPISWIARCKNALTPLLIFIFSLLHFLHIGANTRAAAAEAVVASIRKDELDPEKSQAQPKKRQFKFKNILRGKASWYGRRFHGRKTASGEVFDQSKLTAAHKTLPLGSKAIVTNLENGNSVEVEINDRGPYVGDRVIDVSYAAAKQLGFAKAGTAPVQVEPVKEGTG
jgi:rare lipoprotein A (peptidoglycan hydrolase)